MADGDVVAAAPGAFDVAAHYRQAVADFYRDVLWALGEHAQRGGTATGAAEVVRRVARDYGVREANEVPLPRLTRAERDDLRWAAAQEGRGIELGRRAGR